MQTFETGATRDDSDDKLNYIGFLSPFVIKRYSEYLHAHRKQSDGNMRPADNWKAGIPKQKYLESMARHFMDVWLIHEGCECLDLRDKHTISLEEALCAVIFNAMGYLHELEKPQNATL